MSPESEGAAFSPERSQPETFRARELSVSLTVDDLGESLEWYRDVVGFTVEREHENEGEVVAVELKAGDTRLLINQDDGAKGWDRDKAAGFAVHFTTVQDVDERARLIRARGGTLETEPADMPWGARAFSVRDPTGFRLTISSQG